MAAVDPSARPRVEGEREGEILAATLRLLADVGYDRLTMDAVASAARASKATLYRRWTSKAELVVEAVSRAKGRLDSSSMDTGDLRTDLVSMACAAGGLTDEVPMSVMASLVTAMHREPELAEAFQRTFIGPRLAQALEVFARARARGDLADGVDPRLLATVLPALVVHRVFVLGQDADAAFVERVVDEVVLPACIRPHTH